MRVEWDEGKRAGNLRKHGVDFADAVGALLDPRCLTVDDPGAAREARFVTLGRRILRSPLVGGVDRAGGGRAPHHLGAQSQQR